MGRALSTAEAEAFKALAIVEENPPSTLCSVAVIYAQASERVPYGSERWMHKAMSGLAKRTLEAAVKRVSPSYVQEQRRLVTITQPRIFNTPTNGGEEK